MCLSRLVINGVLHLNMSKNHSLETASTSSLRFASLYFPQPWKRVGPCFHDRPTAPEYTQGSYLNHGNVEASTLLPAFFFECIKPVGLAEVISWSDSSQNLVIGSIPKGPKCLAQSSGRFSTESHFNCNSDSRVVFVGRDLGCSLLFWWCLVGDFQKEDHLL